MSLRRQQAELTFDEYEAAGKVEITRGSYGPTIVVNGLEIGYIDLYPISPAGVEDRTADQQVPCLLIFDPPNDGEPLVKIVLDPKGFRVIINKSAERIDACEGERLNYEGDFAFAGPKPPPET